VPIRAVIFDLYGTLVPEFPHEPVVSSIGTSSPAIANGVLYVGSYDTRLYAIRARSGKLLWAPGWGSGNMERGFNSSPAIADGRVYIGCRDGSLYAFGIG